MGAAAVSLAMVLQGVFALAGPATAHATLPMVHTLCAFNTMSLASLDDPAQRGCKWGAIARAADVGRRAPELHDRGHGERRPPSRHRRQAT